MDDNNKNNLHFFAADSMSQLHQQLLKWQAENQKRFLSLEIQQDEGHFCCLALTNPSEVVIVARDSIDDKYKEVGRVGTKLCVKSY